MATSSYVGIDVSKDRLDVAVLGEDRNISDYTATVLILALSAPRD
jgi:hypothetical protein